MTHWKWKCQFADVLHYVHWFILTNQKQAQGFHKEVHANQQMKACHCNTKNETSFLVILPGHEFFKT
jgi:hypothetical protein